MTYIPVEWATGDVVTAEKLNKMQNGIAVVRLYTLESEGWSVIHSSMSFAEIEQILSADNYADNSSVFMTAQASNVSMPLTQIKWEEGEYVAATFIGINTDFGAPRLQSDTYTIAADDTVTVEHKYYSLTAIS